jgi:hypothetical protein
MYFYNQSRVRLSSKSASENSSLFVKLMSKNSISGDIVTRDMVNVNKVETSEPRVRVSR